MNDAAAQKQKSDVKKALVIVGAIMFIGMILAIAYPAFGNYMLRSKSREAAANLGLLRSAFITECEAGRLPPGLQAGPLPAIPAVEAQTASWSSDSGFVALSFAPDTPVLYSYSVGPSTVDVGDIALTARGDLDGDGEQSLFEIGCRPSECRCADGIFFENELE